MATFLALGLPHGLDFFWIFIALVLLFGAKKLPELARGLGKSLGEFKKAKDEFDREVKASIHDTPAQPVQPSVPTIQPPATTPVGTAVPHPTPIAPAPAPVAEPKKDAGH